MKKIVKLLATIIEKFFRVAEPVNKLFARIISLSYLRSKIKNGVIPITTQFDGRTLIVKDTRLIVGEHCRFSKDVFFETGENGTIVLGNNVRINIGSVFVSHVGIDVGNDSLIGEYVSIRDSDHGVKKGRLTRTQPHIGEKISIGNNVWIGRGTVILKGVTIGDGSVVAANSVVTHDVDSNIVVAGIPARKIKDIK